jgi:hypothetical protein
VNENSIGIATDSKVLDRRSGGRWLLRPGCPSDNPAIVLALDGTEMSEADVAVFHRVGGQLGPQQFLDLFVCADGYRAVNFPG